MGIDAHWSPEEQKEIDKRRKLTEVARKKEEEELNKRKKPYFDLGITKEEISTCMVLEDFMKKKESQKEGLPKVSKIIIEQITPAKYPDLRALYGNFPPFKQKFIYYTNARWGAGTVNIPKSTDSVIGVSIKHPGEEPEAYLKVNELSHAVFEKLYSNISGDISVETIPVLKEFDINSTPLIKINEFLSDVASFAEDSTAEWNRLTILTSKLNTLQYNTIKEISQQISTKESTIATHPDLLLKEVLKLTEEISTLKEDLTILKKIKRHNYELTLRFFSYYKNKGYSKQELAREYFKIGKELITILNKLK